MRIFFIPLTCCLIFASAGCSKPQADRSQSSPQLANTPSAQGSPKAIDACSLLTSKEIEAIQGAPLKETNPRVKSQGGLTVSQCYFVLPTAAESIVLTVTQRGNRADARDPKQLWKEAFHDENKAEPDRKGESKLPRPQEIADLGDEAFWTPLGFGGALFALKGDTQIRISVGGSGDQAAKIQKSKALAEIVLKRL